jgi:hypothetical protein
MKNCTKCGIQKSLLDFYSHPKALDGRQSSCKVCCMKTQKPHTKKYFERHPEENRAQKRRYMAQYRNNPINKLSAITRNLIHGSFKRACNGSYVKSDRTESILGCTIPEFISYLQSRFQPGMTLENHGAGPGNWNMDHIIPVSSATCEDDIIRFNHYSNIQPLWFEDNMAKGDKLDWLP